MVEEAVVTESRPVVGNRGSFSLTHAPASAEPEEGFEVEAETGELPALERKDTKDVATLEPDKVVEAALFLANRPLTFAELALVARCTVKKAGDVVGALKKRYADAGSAVEVLVEDGTATLHVRPEFLAPVAKLSKEIELSRKATKILALIAKKRELLQSELKRYFRGEIYAYVSELKEAGYVTSEKKGLTRLLKPTKKFYETFQVSV